METLLRKLKARKITIKVVKGSLQVRMPKGIDAKGILKEIKENKEGLTRFIEGTFIKKQRTIKLDYQKLKQFEEQEIYDITFNQSKEYMRYLIKGKHSHNMVFSVLVDNLDIEAMKKAIIKLFERHEILRTKYVFENGKIGQKIINEIDEQQVIEILALSSNESPENRVNKEMDSLVAQKFDFDKDFLISIKIGVFSKKTQGLLIGVHHAICDARSTEIIKNEIIEIYENIKENKDTEMKPLKLQFKEYAFLTENLAEASQAKEFYKRNIIESLSLNGHTYFEVIKNIKNSYRQRLTKEIEKIQSFNKKEGQKLPNVFGYLYNLMPEKNGGVYEFFITTDKIRKIETLSSLYNTSKFMVLLALFSFEIADVKLRKSTRIMVPFSTRISEELIDIIGWMSSEVLVCISINPSLGMPEFVKHISELMAEASFYRFYHQEKVMNDLDLNLNIVAPDFVNYIVDNEDYIGDMSPRHVETGAETHFELKTLITHYNNCIKVNSVYKLEYFDNRQIEHFWAGYVDKIEKLIQNPNASLKELRGIKLHKKENSK